MTVLFGHLNHYILSDVIAFSNKQAVSWLTSAPSILKDCLQAISNPDDLKSLLQHHKCLEHLSSQGKCLLTKYSLQGFLHLCY